MFGSGRFMRYAGLPWSSKRTGIILYCMNSYDGRKRRGRNNIDVNPPLSCNMRTPTSSVPKMLPNSLPNAIVFRPSRKTGFIPAKTIAPDKCIAVRSNAMLKVEKRRMKRHGDNNNFVFALPTPG